MLRLIPRPLHIAALRSAHFVRLRWWRLTRARVFGCRVVVLDGEDQVLLIRHSYGSGNWMLPGGGLKPKEDALAAARREVFEEVAVRLSDTVAIAVTSGILHGASHDVQIIAGWTDDVPQADQREIIEAQFFPVNRLPRGMAHKLAGALPGYTTAAKAARSRPE
jgi:8-oxo-dGTP pyrophosphatase MutT (NUDIX family)